MITFFTFEPTKQTIDMKTKKLVNPQLPVIKALKPINNRWFNAANKANALYEYYNRLRDMAYDMAYDAIGEESKEYRKYDKLCQKYFDKYLEACDELPKYEIKRLENSNIY